MYLFIISNSKVLRNWNLMQPISIGNYMTSVTFKNLWGLIYLCINVMTYLCIHNVLPNPFIGSLAESGNLTGSRFLSTTFDIFGWTLSFVETGATPRKSGLKVKIRKEKNKRESFYYKIHYKYVIYYKIYIIYFIHFFFCFLYKY